MARVLLVCSSFGVGSGVNEFLKSFKFNPNVHKIQGVEWSLEEDVTRAGKAREPLKQEGEARPPPTPRPAGRVVPEKEAEGIARDERRRRYDVLRRMCALAQTILGTGRLVRARALLWIAPSES